MSAKQLTREELIKLHCENQDCEGCPKEQECDEADAEAMSEDFDFCETDYDETGGYP